MVEALYWDSNFFRLRIGRTMIHDLAEAETLLAQTDFIKSNFDLVYVFADEEITFVQKGATLVDRKIEYTKQAMPKSFDNISFYISNFVDDDLYRLAIESGKFSRYKLDENFPDGSYERLYRAWIENSVNHQLASDIIVHKSDGIDGMITLMKKGSMARIGLVAVDNRMQQRGIGSQMMQALEGYSFSSGVQQINVVTQWKNEGARSWYEKNGFMIDSVTNVYHWWL